MDEKRPIIGCTEPSYFQPQILQTIEQFFDGNPIKLCQNKKEDLHYWLSQCNAVILSGGSDIHPRTYGQPVLNEFNFSKFDVPRDIREIKIIQFCLERDIPMLGICRGHQMLGIFSGLKFIPDISNGPVCHQPKSQNISAGKDEPMHWVWLTNEAGKEYEVLDDTSDLFFGSRRDNRYLWVNSFHHQAIQYEKKPQHVKILGISPGVEKDQKIAELMAGVEYRWLSCQWHPEYDWDVNPASKMVLTKFKEMMSSKVSAPKKEWQDA